jgi:hypothetical protein
VATTLTAIVILGILSTMLITQLRVPQFLIYTSYIVVAIFFFMIPLSVKGSKVAYVVNIFLALLVMIANASISQHTAILFRPNFLYGSIILLVGAYVLQPILLATSILALRAKRKESKA